MNAMEIIGENICQARNAIGMTQGELASYAGLNRTSVTNLEKGRQNIPLNKFIAICAILGLSPSDAFAGIDIDRSASEQFRELREQMEKIKSQMNGLLGG